MEDFEKEVIGDENEQAKPNESKADKFKRLAAFRVNKALTYITAIGKLSSRSSYEYTEEQTSKMFSALRNAIDAEEAKFKPRQQQAENSFTF